VKWLTAWQLIRDVLVTGTGLVIILLQVFAKQPSDVLLVAAIALTTPTLASHATALLSGQPPSESSSSSSQPGSPPSSSSRGTGESANGVGPGQ